MSFAKPGALRVARIKPQFEAERHEVGKKGVVRDAAVHERVCAEVRSWLTGEGWDVADLVESPITGPEGKVEFLIDGRTRTACGRAGQQRHKNNGRAQGGRGETEGEGRERVR